MGNFFRDIRFWIFLFFIIRLFGITNPPLEPAHNWRQTTVLMAARNFLETDANIFYPRVDFAGEKTGITGMEFPLLNYLIYLASLVFSYEHWYGRLINLVVSSFGIWYFFKLVKKYFNQQIAFNAAFLLLFSVWFTYSRKIMPDTFSMSLVIAGVYYGACYLQDKNTFKNLLLYFALTLLGVLSKVPSAYFLVILFPVFLKSSTAPSARILFLVISLLIVIPMAVYYFYWVPYLTSRFGFEHFFMGGGIINGAKELFSEPRNTLEKFYLDALQIIGFLFFVAGLVLAIIKEEKKLLMIFVLGFTSFLIVILKAGLTFSHHSYYMVPFVPFMALLAAFAIIQIREAKTQWIVLALIMIESLLNKNRDFYIKEDFKAILNLESHLDTLGKRDEKIAINSGYVPTPMYFAHRKGWITTNSQLLDSNYVNGLKSQGLRHIVILKKTFGKDASLPYKIKISNADYTIYQP